jgi:hypothetical protein
LIAGRIGRVCRSRLAAIFSLEQRVALDFRFQEGLQLDIRHLQELDRLLQLRRHHQPLGLAQFEFGTYSHVRLYRRRTFTTLNNSAAATLAIG